LARWSDEEGRGDGVLLSFREKRKKEPRKKSRVRQTAFAGKLLRKRAQSQRIAPYEGNPLVGWQEGMDGRGLGTFFLAPYEGAAFVRGGTL